MKYDCNLNLFVMSHLHRLLFVHRFIQLSPRTVWKIKGRIDRWDLTFAHAVLESMFKLFFLPPLFRNLLWCHVRKKVFIIRHVVGSLIKASLTCPQRWYPSHPCSPVQWSVYWTSSNILTVSILVFTWRKHVMSGPTQQFVKNCKNCKKQIKIFFIRILN